MKRIAFTVALALSLGLNSAWAEGNETDSSVRTIKSPRFARPLIEKWIEEYAHIHFPQEAALEKGPEE